MKLDSMTLTEKTSYLRELLIANECLLTFTKVDGTKRSMPCTLNPHIVPPTPAPKVLAEGEITKVKKSNPDVMSVFCTDKQEWRSFRIMNAEDIRVIVSSDLTE